MAVAEAVWARAVAETWAAVAAFTVLVEMETKTSRTFAEEDAVAVVEVVQVVTREVEVKLVVVVVIMVQEVKGSRTTRL